MGRKWEGNFYSILCGKEREGKKLYFWCEKEREGKGRGKNCIFIREGNGKDKMSFPSVGRKWEGNIENFWNGREMGRN